MKLIHKFKSPNFDKRASSKILFIIIHYTALKNYREAISYLSDPKNKVSSHYLISQTGAIFNLVSSKNRAWHAGISYWDGITDLNSTSIGIELDFIGKGLNEKAIVASCNNTKYQLELGKEVLNIDPRYFRPTEVDLLIGDPTKAKTKLGWKLEYDLPSLVDDMMKNDLLLMNKEQYLKKGGYDTLNYFE